MRFDHFGASLPRRQETPEQREQFYRDWAEAFGQAEADALRAAEGTGRPVKAQWDPEAPGAFAEFGKARKGRK